ncbi:hypothetical protein ACFU7Y_26870 [Kitasatospora sp. NPDC057542]|uniref:hypothetical protein n=1 Tax=Streptomycetaceae TaxID=2062 RepID=UPI001CC9D082|nr:hypothetical protein [Streptomyces sp. LS1784]
MPAADPPMWTRTTLRNKVMTEMEQADPGVALADLDGITKDKCAAIGDQAERDCPTTLSGSSVGVALVAP